MIKLKNIEPLAPNGFKATYDVEHSTPGAEGTCLREDVQLTVYPERTTASMVIDNCSGETPNEALDRMVKWLRRLADGLEERNTSIILPLR